MFIYHRLSLSVLLEKWVYPENVYVFCVIFLKSTFFLTEKDAPLVEFIYLLFARMPGENYRSLLVLRISSAN